MFPCSFLMERVVMRAKGTNIFVHVRRATSYYTGDLPIYASYVGLAAVVVSLNTVRTLHFMSSIA